MPGHYGKSMKGSAKMAPAKGKPAKRDAMMELGIMPAMKKPMKKVAKKK